MEKRRNYSFRQDLEQRLKDSAFREAWEESEPEYLLARELIKARLSRRWSQRKLAQEAGTTQAVISRLETMQTSPSLALIKRLAAALNYRLLITLEKA
jgi:ribosome-binding protein aMBF1 (putative translation factor)